MILSADELAYVQRIRDALSRSRGWRSAMIAVYALALLAFFAILVAWLRFVISSDWDGIGIGFGVGVAIGAGSGLAIAQLAHGLFTWCFHVGKTESLLLRCVDALREAEPVAAEQPQATH
jgi:hypothetical protein